METLDGRVEETNKKVEKLGDKMEKLTKSVIPPNVREQYDMGIQKWREEDKLYYETHSFPSVMEKVRNQPYVTFVGVPGSGKSVTAHHIALKLQEEGYEVVPTKDVRKMEDYGDPRNPQVFVIDDVVGVFGLQETELKVMINYEQKITKPCMGKSRTLMTCREAVFNETLPYKPFLTKEENVIRLHSSDHALNGKDKKQILQKYGLNADLMSPELLKSTSRMFPLLCKLYSKEGKFQALGYKFFLNPVQCIIDELDNVQKHNKLNYATLVLCMLNENRLSKDILKDRKNEHFMNMKIYSLENCELESQTDAFKFVKALSAMEGTYTKHSGTQYTFIHDSMFEICAYHYGQQFPDQMLLYMSSSYIANYVKPQLTKSCIAHKMKEKQGDSQSSKGDSNGSDRKKESDDKSNEREESFDLCIRICEDQYPLLAKRLYRDIQNMELNDVFRNQALKHPQVCQAIIGVLETKSYKELKSLFLSSHGEVNKIVSKHKCVVKKSEERRKGPEWLRQTLVDQRWKQYDKREMSYNEDTYNVRVISWVIYYGHYQILENIMQQTEQHNEISELFEITENSPHQSKFAIYTCNKQESEINRLLEQHRLLLLSCYSGNVRTVRVLLPVCQKAVNGLGRISEGIDWCYYTPLTAACEKGYVGIVKELMKEGADVNQRNRWGDTPLMAACKGGHVSVVEELARAGADVNLQHDFMHTPLIAACWGGHACVVKKLLKVGADVNLQDSDGSTPLIVACGKGNVSVVEALVKAGAAVNIQDDCRNTPLIAACKEGHASVVEEMVKSGADVNLEDGHGNIPLIAACKGGHVSVVEELANAGAEVNLQDGHGNIPLIAACQGGHVSVVEEMVKSGADVNLKDGHGNIPLIAACKGGHVSVVEELANAGAEVNLQDGHGNSPLIAACEGGYASVVEELARAGADVNLQDGYGNIPLIATCSRGHVCVLKKLVIAGADVNLQNRAGNTPMIAACKGGHVTVVEELVKVGADVNLQDGYGNIPPVSACEEGFMSVVIELFNVGAYVNLQNDDRNTPLIAACKGGHVSVVEELVKAGADVNLHDTSMWGNTPLIAACKEGHVGVVEELVKAGADVNLQGRLRSTPLIAACYGGHVSVVEELVKAGADVNLQGRLRSTPLIAACYGGNVSVVEELVKTGADVNLQDTQRNTPLIVAVRQDSSSTVKYLVEHGADLVIEVDDFKMSAVYTALILNKPDIVKYLIQQQNKITPGQLTGNVHLFNCLVEIRHAGVKTDSRDDVVVTDRSLCCMDCKCVDLWMTIMWGDCDVLRHLLCVGLNVNQSLHWYDKYSDDKCDVKPLLYTLIDDEYVEHRTEKVSILLGAGVDVNVRVRDREYDSVLDREDVSVLERTRRWVCEYGDDLYDSEDSDSEDSDSEYSSGKEFMKVMCEVKKHVRRHSV